MKIINIIDDLISAAGQRVALTEQQGADSGPAQTLTHIESDEECGFIRIWRGDGAHLIDRMIHVQLISDPVSTQLLFLFGRSDTPMPHFHAQLVSFSPEDCVYNADFLPRLDPVEYPDYADVVLKPLNEPYWKAINNRDNVCSLAPANPMIAQYLSPWSIGVGRPAKYSELERVSPQIMAFLDHYLALASTLDFAGPDAATLRARDARHLNTFFSDSLDPRAWQGVYRLIGEDAGKAMKQTLQTTLF